MAQRVTCPLNGSCSALHLFRPSSAPDQLWQLPAPAIQPSSLDPSHPRRVPLPTDGQLALVHCLVFIPSLLPATALPVAILPPAPPSPTRTPYFALVSSFTRCIPLHLCRPMNNWRWCTALSIWQPSQAATWTTNACAGVAILPGIHSLIDFVQNTWGV